MATPGNISTIFASTQKLLQAKAQLAWKNLAEQAASSSQPAGSTGQTEQLSVSSVITLIDPEARDKLRTMQQDAESLAQKLSSGTETNREAAMRKAEDAKRRLKSLKMQAQMAAASGDVKAAARIAREVAQVAKELGQAVKEYGGSGADAAIAVGSISTAGQQTMTAPDAIDAETAASGASAMATGSITDSGEGDAGGDQQPEKEDHEYPVAEELPAETTSDAQPVIVDTLAMPAIGHASPAPDIESKRSAIMKDGAERKASIEFYNDTRGTMAQLRAILEQMKKLARRDGTVGMVAQMDQASRDMAEGERLLNDAASPGIIALPSGSLVEVSA
jgi:flagellar capping protein FliD